MLILLPSVAVVGNALEAGGGGGKLLGVLAFGLDTEAAVGAGVAPEMLAMLKRTPIGPANLPVRFLIGRRA